MNIVVDNYIRIPVSQIDESWIDPLLELVSILNEDKVTAMKEKIYGAKNMPDRIYLGGVVNDEIMLPRGFLPELERRLTEFGVDYNIKLYDSYKTRTLYEEDAVNVIPREDQLEAIEAIRDNNYSGIANMSTGFGKTVVGLICALESGRKTLILVDKISLATQWQDRYDEHFDMVMPMGLLGDGEWDEQDITVATLQTIHSRKDQLDDDWWDQWGLVIHDESHHVVSDTYHYILNNFSGARLGLSATVGKSPVKQEKAKLTFGPIIYENLEIKDKPKLFKIDTKFEYDYENTHIDEKTNKRVQNNYQDLIATLIVDSHRNNLIGSYIASDVEAAHLIVSRRLAHLEAIQYSAISNGFPSQDCFMLTGKETLEERENIILRAAQGHIAIFSTVADEGLDIPRLDRIHLPFPTKDAEAIKQQVGRGLRKHPDKTECFVYDYVDVNCPVLKNQWRKRLNGYYRKNEILPQ